jgi:hypothetical protein
VVIASTVDMRRTRLVAEDIETLREISAALHKFDTATTFFPLSLVHLTTRPAATDDNTCGADLTATAVGAWANTGPFWPQQISGPIQLTIGSIGTTLTRIGATTPATVRAIIQISITSVAIDDALDLNTAVDADAVTGQASNPENAARGRAPRRRRWGPRL